MSEGCDREIRELQQSAREADHLLQEFSSEVEKRVLASFRAASESARADHEASVHQLRGNIEKSIDSSVRSIREDFQAELKSLRQVSEQLQQTLTAEIVLLKRRIFQLMILCGLLSGLIVLVLLLNVSGQ